jgi:hypothetical protein
MIRVARVVTVLVLLGSACTHHSFHVEPRFTVGQWAPDCDSMLEKEALGTWSVGYSPRPYVAAKLHPPDGIWVLDVKEYASRGRDSAAEDRRLRTVTLRCEPDDAVSLPAVACLVPETRYFGWASSEVRTGTRVFVDASALAKGGSRGTGKQPCRLELRIEHGAEQDDATSRVLLREHLQAWVDYRHVQ